MRTLITVESPVKARTLGNFLSKDYTVKASVGHIRNLLPQEMGVTAHQMIVFPRPFTLK